MKKFKSGLVLGKFLPPHNGHLYLIELWLLLTPDVPWIDDGTRDFPDIKDRQRHYERIKELLTEQGIQYKNISGSFDNRLNQAIDEINRIL